MTNSLFAFFQGLRPRRSQGIFLARVVTWGLVLCWVLASRWLPPYLLPPPWEVGERVVQLFFSETLAVHTYRSLARVLAAMLLAISLGGGLALLAFYSSRWRPLVIDRLLPTLNAFPTFGWAILAVIWFRLGEVTVIFVETVILIPFILINLWEGLNRQDEELLEMARSFSGAGRPVFIRVVLPMLAPYLWAGMRVCYGVAWKIALIAEIFGASSGLGYLLNYARSQFDSSMVFGVIAVIVIQVFVVDRLLFARISPYQAK